MCATQFVHITRGSVEIQEEGYAMHLPFGNALLKLKMMVPINTQKVGRTALVENRDSISTSSEYYWRRNLLVQF